MEVRESGLLWVIAGFTTLVGLNLVTLALGPQDVLLRLNSERWGFLLSVFVFDTWGTVGGLAGVMALFTPILLGVDRERRRKLSIFFLSASVGIGFAASASWTIFYNSTGVIGAGSSSIAIAAQGLLFALSIFGLFRLRGTPEVGTRSDYRWYLATAYFVIVLSTLYLVLLLQPIFVPTVLYNWRVHEIAFLLSLAATVAYEGAVLSSKRTGVI